MNHMPGCPGVARTTALRLTSGSFTDSVSQHLLPHELLRPGAAYHEARQSTSAVRTGQRQVYGGSRDGSSVF